MKKLAITMLSLILPAIAVDAADVRLTSLAEFDQASHKINLNLEAEVRGGCLPDSARLGETYESLLNTLGFQLAPLDDSHLEFAVSLVGFATSGPQSCGVRVLSMARQVPEMKLLRLSPGSKSTRFRLWTRNNLLTGSKAEIQAMLEEQARKDVLEFARAFGNSKK